MRAEQGDAPPMAVPIHFHPIDAGPIPIRSIGARRDRARPGGGLAGFAAPASG